jgi:hypothetical protein
LIFRLAGVPVIDRLTAGIGEGDSRMNKALKIVLLILGTLVAVAILFGIGYRLYWLFAGGAGLFGGFHPMMRGSWGMYPMRMAGWLPFGGFLGVLVLLSLLGVGIAILVRRNSGPKAAPRLCAKCGRPIEADWVVCPHCGEKV